MTPDEEARRATNTLLRTGLQGVSPEVLREFIKQGIKALGKMYLVVHDIDTGLSEHFLTFGEEGPNEILANCILKGLAEFGVPTDDIQEISGLIQNKKINQARELYSEITASFFVIKELCFDSKLPQFSFSENNQEPNQDLG